MSILQFTLVKNVHEEVVQTIVEAWRKCSYLISESDKPFDCKRSRKAQAISSAFRCFSAFSWNSAKLATPPEACPMQRMLSVAWLKSTISNLWMQKSDYDGGTKFVSRKHMSC